MALLGNLTGSSQFFNSDAFYNDVATQSLRFDEGSTAMLVRTPSSAGNRRTFTISMWVKIADVVGTHVLINAFASASPNNQGLARFSSSALQFTNFNTNYDLVTNRLFRDSSAWYHLVFAVDTTQGTASNRIKIYVNGVQETSFSTETYPDQNLEMEWNNTVKHLIGARTDNDTPSPIQRYDGYMAEVNLVDGNAYDPTYFGETKNGVWIPKRYSGSYGTNGFRLQFNQTGVGTASTSTIGADTSGNTHHFTSSNIAASDCNMPDSPENNFATMNPLDVGGAITYTEGNLKMVVSSGSMEGSRATMALPQSGKWYWEVGVTALGYISQVGIATHEKLLANTADGAADHIAWGFGTWMSTYNSSVSKYQVNVGGSGGDNWVAIPATGDVLGLAYDADNGKLWFAKNGTYQNTSGTANPATGDDPRASSLTGKEWFPLYAGYPDGSPAYIMNFGQDSSFAGTETAQGNTDENGIGDFYYAPPSGYLALCTSNLPEPTIGPNVATQSDDHFNTVLYTGSGSTQSITTVGFQSDWTWFKRLDASVNHALYDSNRGGTNALRSNTDGAEAQFGDAVVTFLSNGFQIAGTNVSGINGSSEYMVAWNWKANGGTTTTNDASSTGVGTIDSVIQANTTAGFSIVTYTGTGSAGTIAHGLGAVPQMFIVKNRDSAESWVVYHHKNTSAPETDAVQLNLSDATVDSAGAWNDTAPTSSVFSVGSGNASNKSGDDLVAYVFTEIEGYSKFGSYTANQNDDGPFVYLGFKPAFIIVKNVTTSSRNWSMMDDTRFGVGTTNVINPVISHLKANDPDAEYDSTSITMLDILSNGFKVRIGGTDNGIGRNMNRNSGDTVIYMAFASSPFKYANAK